MRDILFKAKRLDNGEWIEGNYVNGYTFHYILPIPMAFAQSGCAIVVNKATICQYTGLKDKNGIKIYEGDIVKFDEYKYEKLVQSIISEIKWCEELCSLSLVVSERQGTRGTLSHLLDYNKEVKVIGNIFDNPELLNYADNDASQQAHQEVLKLATD